MKIRLVVISVSFCFSVSLYSQESKQLYQNNRAPLKENIYMELPLGAIKPEGWLLDQLNLMRDGLTGHLDEIYPEVVGENNGWLGGDGDGWERGPYWIDGLLPLAYILNDDTLKAKALEWVDWSLNNQQENGYFGPVPFKKKVEKIPGVQRTKRQDWWPKMVMLKVLQQYYNATNDQRVLILMDKYFRFQLKQLPEEPLDFLTFWGNRRGGDNLMIVYWFYNITGEDYLLELAELIHEQTFPWGTVFLNDDVTKSAETPWHCFEIKKYPFDENELDNLSLKHFGGFHCVNVAQGIKEPLVYFQQNRDSSLVKAVKRAFYDLKTYHGQAQGMFGGDEPLHGTDPTQGIELCSVVEMMYSLETMLKITSDIGFADHLEKLAFNALPTQVMDDYMMKQYFQAANQVEISRNPNNFYQDVEHDYTGSCFGTVSGYPCCLCNMHQGWPKFTQNLWYATADHGLAALVYSSSEVTAKVGNGITVRFLEETNYPFNDTIRFTCTTDQDISFPLHLRIPAWCEQATVITNKHDFTEEQGNKILILDRKWSDGDVLELVLPMKLKTSRWHDFSVAVERGPLVYSLKIEESWKFIENKDKFKDYYEVYPASQWNYSLIEDDLQDLEKNFKFVSLHNNSAYPWNIKNSPVAIKARAAITPGWRKITGIPLSIPWSPKDLKNENLHLHEIELIPYGCTTLRITEFPTINIVK